MKSIEELEMMFRRIEDRLDYRLGPFEFRSAHEAVQWLDAICTAGPRRIIHRAVPMLPGDKTVQVAIAWAVRAHPHPRPQWLDHDDKEWGFGISPRAGRGRRVMFHDGTFFDYGRLAETPHERWADACRHAVRPGISRFRAEVPVPAQCPLLRVPLEADGADVDHAPPHELAEIARAYRDEKHPTGQMESLMVDHVRYYARWCQYEHHPGVVDRSVLPADLRLDFCRFHDARARLRWVSRGANRVLLRSAHRSYLLTKDEDVPGIPWDTASWCHHAIDTTKDDREDS